MAIMSRAALRCPPEEACAASAGVWCAEAALAGQGGLGYGREVFGDAGDHGVGRGASRVVDGGVGRRQASAHWCRPDIGAFDGRAHEVGGNLVGDGAGAAGRGRGQLDRDFALDFRTIYILVLTLVSLRWLGRAIRATGS